MAPKKKKAEEQKKKIVDDKTFGLKNKKKSKKVQTYVATVKKQASQKVDGARNRGGSSSAAGGASSSHLAQMAARLAELELMNQPVKDKVKKMSAEEAERKRIEEEEEAERIRIANLPVEDQIEEERAKLKTRTPVTMELFLAWKAEKDAERAANEEAARAAAHKKMSRTERTRGQGLSGRELFTSNADLFVDDDEADDAALKVSSDYIGDADEDNADNADDQDKDDTAGGDEQAVVADASLFGAPAEPDPPQSEAVGVGDESLFT